ncbi:MAG TPA: SHOCT domain-containing protein [Actinomycetota bacterium]|nr:SHOCT domain-containing protein [Actinomycetota bacterium]
MIESLLGRHGPFIGPPWQDPWWHGLLGTVVPLLLLLGLAALVVWAVLRVSDRHPPASLSQPPWPARPADTALEQARLRYARGEMSREEFLQISSDLQGGSPREA